ncbi:hypothetical protein RUM43_009952, partial [Polyplax serrata]
MEPIILNQNLQETRCEETGRKEKRERERKGKRNNEFAQGQYTEVKSNKIERTMKEHIIYRKGGVSLEEPR